MTSLLAPSENILCAECEKILRHFHPNAVWHFHDTRPLGSEDPRVEDIVHHSNGDSLLTAAKHGCRICTILIRYIQRGHVNISHDFYIEAYGSSNQITLNVMRHGMSWRTKGSHTQVGLEISWESSTTYDRLIDTCLSSPLSESLHDAAVLKLAKEWFNNCRLNTRGHQTCVTSSQENHGPPRLLDVSDHSVRLSLKNQRIEEEPYCALSYCWGTSGQIMLTASNEEAFSQGIEISLLPKSIRDAIHVTRSLGLRYVWIDSLCIIQSGDNGVDWNYHSTKMSEIYANCDINLSADQAGTVGDGFLNERAGPAIRPVFYEPHLDPSIPQRKCVVTFTNVADMALASEPLGSRAWVFSERLLSPRTLHFGAGEMFWECSGCILASETCPEGFGVFQRNEVFMDFTLSDDLSAEERVKTWIKILNSYSRLSLTMPNSDKLVALAGIGRLYEKHTGNSLIAGVLKDSLPFSLLWCRAPDFTQTGRSPVYRAPSWSWACFDGPLYFYCCLESWGKTKPIAEVLDVWVKPKEGQDHLGQIEHGAITICGPTISLADWKRHALSQYSDRLRLYWDMPEDENAERFCCLILLVSRWTKGCDWYDALLVIPGKKNETWSRIGTACLAFEHKSGHESSGISADCQRFIDGLNKRKFTIV